MTNQNRHGGSPPDVAPGDHIAALAIEAMSHGSHAIARHRGRVVFVTGAAPGDVADVVVTEAHPRFVRARIQALRESGTARRQSPCPWVGRCGGCQWQHLTYQAQLEAKHRNFIDHIVRIAGLAPDAVQPVIPSPEEWRYRHRIILRVDGRHLGFYHAASHELVEIDTCLIAAEPLEHALAIARRWLAAVKTRIRRLSLVASEDTPGVVLVANAEGPLASADDAENRSELLTRDGIRGVVMFGKGWWRSWGDVTATLHADGTPFTTTGGEFTQVNLAGNRVLVQTVLGLAAVASDEHILDLYCGAGNLALPVARRAARVLGIERSRRAVADAEANTKRLGLTNCQFVCAPVERAIRQLGAGHAHARLVILDPPRGGAATILDDVVALRPERVLYVSCDPPTLARDLARLAQHGYRLHVAQPIDLFPQTYHLEVVAVLHRN